MSEKLKGWKLHKHLQELSKINPEEAKKQLLKEHWKRTHRPMGISGKNASQARKFKKDYCERCGSKDNLVVHHKNKNQTDNRPENIETLCRLCHNQHHLRRKRPYE